MSASYVLMISFGVLCAVTGGVIVWMALRPRRKALAAYRVPESTRYVVGSSFSEGFANPIDGYRELFEQFDVAIHDTELGFDARRTPQPEIVFALTSIDDSTTFVAHADVYDVDTITRGELSALRSHIGL